MKKKLLKTIMILSKGFLYGLVFQMLVVNFTSVIQAKGQYKSIEEVEVTLSGNKLGVFTFFEEVKRQTSFRFSYDKKSLKRSKAISFSATNGTVEDFLIEVSHQSNLFFRQFNNTIDVKMVNRESVIKDQFLDPITISGTVKDATGEPLPGATISVMGGNKGTVTGIDGTYSIEVETGVTLVFSYIGFQNQSFDIGNQTTIDVTLLEDESSLEEVVVVGYAEQRKLSVTGAVSSVSSDELVKSSSPSLANALAGRLPGLTSIQSGGGQPGRDDATLYLRGAATTNGRSPLILIDGVPRDNIRTLDANEVESVTVLKDASATAVFGVRGANGVIIITTKRGKEGEMQLNVSLDQSFSSFTYEPERLTSLEYMNLRNEAGRNDGMTTPFFSEEVMAKYANPLTGLDPNDPDYERKAMVRQYMYPNHDYYREFISRYSPQTRVNVSARGGTDKVSYFVNGAYLNQGGNLNTEPESQLGYDPSSWMKRYNFRGNLDYKISDSFKAFLNIGSYIEQVNMPAAWLYGGGDTNWMMRDLFYQAQTILPITPGPTTIDGFGVAPGQIVDPGYMDRSAFEIMNRFGYRNEVRSNLNSSFGLELDLSNMVTEGLSVRGMISYDARATTAMEGSKSERLFLAEVNPDTDELSYAVKRPDETLLSLSKGADSRFNINMQAAIQYSRTFNDKHRVGGLILAQRDNWESTIGEIPFNVLGIAARATYEYDYRYLAEINIGYNGSEQFAPGKRFGFFPAVSLGWIISNENFLLNNPVFTNIKLRASNGRVGNDQMGSARFLYQSDITMSGGPLPSLGRGQGVSQGLLGNPNITWEIADKQNYGIDLGIMDQLDLSFDYYIENRTNILISRGTVPSFQGVPLNNIPKVNMGEVDNSGFELELVYRKHLSEDFNINVRGNYGYNHNVVKFIDEQIRDESYVHRYRSTGYSIGQNWGYQIDYDNGNGIFNSQEELDAYRGKTQYGFGEPRVGDFIYKDLNEDGIVDDKDRTPIGYSSIPRVTYGAGISLQYKSFDFSIFFQGVGKYSGNYAAQGVYENIIQGTYFDYHKNAWTPERYASGEEITYPALSTRSTTNHTANSFFIMDRSFVRLKNLDIGYTLPNYLINAIGMSSLRVYVGGQNLLTWDNLRMGHLDPENNDSIGYPVTRMMNFGFNATF
ncbi:SusC/RagA family TonB-linked outer membrane protein [Cyclobacterium marinum]|uniref:SusC/RagA family TonB-linked outer membrane protein n=1 Tax=Cyclobacterium marinum TaxID=104 RepID=UPI0018DDD0E6|nr:TonB-dependent receptor [Cyclobacterium marinum]MBI0397108.1 TonB-dependent receptor [Cyclobacterium marinum]